MSRPPVGRADRDSPRARAPHRWWVRGVLFTASLVLPTSATAQVGGAVSAPREFPMTRGTVVDRMAELQRIHTPEGIEVMEQVEVNGSRQWISIRGLNRHNPILLVVHGGPGSAMLASSWAYQKPWEDFFTVVNWDQRGVGKNWDPADTARLRPTMTLEQHVQDAEVIVRHVLARLGHRKLVLLAWSWGTAFTPRLVQRHPELFHAWVGTGVVGTEPPIGGDVLHARLTEIARANTDSQAIRELSALDPQVADGPSGIERALALRSWARRYDGGWYGKPTLDLFFALSDWGPEYSDAEAATLISATQWGARAITADAASRGTPSARYDVPMLFLMGRYDLHTPFASARAHFDRIEAPHKRFITFERSAHFVMLEEPGRFLLTLVQEVLPLAGGAAAFEVQPEPRRR
jgi:proline iminopeptidase